MPIKMDIPWLSWQQTMKQAD